MSKEQLHKRLDEQTVVRILERYLAKELSAAEGMEYLGLKRARFFRVVQAYREQPDQFSIGYRRTTPTKLSGKYPRRESQERE